jgi:hypothetical protein
MPKPHPDLRYSYYAVEMVGKQLRIEEKLKLEKVLRDESSDSPRT